MTLAPAPENAPPPPEAAKAKEIPQARRQQELARVASNLFYRKAAEGEGEGKTPTEGQRVLSGIIKLGEGRIPSVDSDFSKGSPIQITRTEKTVMGENNETYTLRGIVGASEGNITCEMVSKDGTVKTFEVSTQDLANAQLLAEADKILPEFSGDEEVIVKKYIETVKDPKTEIGADVDSLISKQATESGMLTVSDLTDFLKSIEAKNSSLSPGEQAESAKLIEGFKKTAEGKILSDRDTLADMFKAGGFTPEKFQSEFELAQQSLKKLQEQAKKVPGNELIQQQLLEMRIRVHVLEQGIKAFDKDGLIDQIFTKMDRGDFPPEQAKKIAEMIRNGNVGGVIEEEANHELPPEERQKLKEALLKISKDGGLLSLFLIIILGTGAENFKGVVSLDQGR